MLISHSDIPETPEPGAATGSPVEGMTEVKRYSANWREVVRRLVSGALVMVVASAILAFWSVNGAILLLQIGSVILLLCLLWFRLTFRQFVLHKEGVGVRIQDNADSEGIWRWEAINRIEGRRNQIGFRGIPLLRWGTQTYYTADGPAFSISYLTARADELGERIAYAFARCDLPRRLADFQAGNPLPWAHVTFSAQSIRSAYYEFYWEDRPWVHVINRDVWLSCRPHLPHRIYLGPLSLPGTLVLVGLVDHLSGEHYLPTFENLDVERIPTYTPLSVRERSALYMLVVFGATVLALTCMASGVYRNWINSVQQQAARPDFQNRFGAESYSVCKDKTVQAQPSDSPNQYVVIDTDNSQVYEPYQKALSSAAATSKADATAVICLVHTRQIIGQCLYHLWSDESNTLYVEIDQFVSQFDIRVIDIQSHRLIRAGKIDGDVPGKCPAYRQYSGNSEIVGAPPSIQSFLNWWNGANQTAIPPLTPEIKARAVGHGNLTGLS